MLYSYTCAHIFTVRHKFCYYTLYFFANIFNNNYYYYVYDIKYNHNITIETIIQ